MIAGRLSLAGLSAASPCSPPADRPNTNGPRLSRSTPSLHIRHFYRNTPTMPMPRRPRVVSRSFTTSRRGRWHRRTPASRGIRRIWRQSRMVRTPQAAREEMASRERAAAWQRAQANETAASLAGVLTAISHGTRGGSRARPAQGDRRLSGGAWILPQPAGGGSRARCAGKAPGEQLPPRALARARYESPRLSDHVGTDERSGGDGRLRERQANRSSLQGRTDE